MVAPGWLVGKQPMKAARNKALLEICVHRTTIAHRICRMHRAPCEILQLPTKYVAPGHRTKLIAQNTIAHRICRTGAPCEILQLPTKMSHRGTVPNWQLQFLYCATFHLVKTSLTYFVLASISYSVDCGYRRDVFTAQTSRQSCLGKVCWLLKWFANEGKPPWGTALERYVAHRIHRTVFICYTNNKIELTQINILELIVATRAELTILV